MFRAAVLHIKPPVALGGGGIKNFILLIMLVTQSCTTLCDPMDWSLPGSSVQPTDRVMVTVKL